MIFSSPSVDGTQHLFFGVYYPVIEDEASIRAQGEEFESRIQYKENLSIFGGMCRDHRDVVHFTLLSPPGS